MTKTTTRRPSSAICGNCDRAIALVSFEVGTHGDPNDPRRTVREYAHDWNGSCQSDEGGRHTAWPKQPPAWDRGPLAGYVPNPEFEANI